MTTHKEMTLPESVTLYKVDIPNVGTMLTFAEPINPDCTFIMGEYTRHPKPMVQAEATLREDGGGAMCYSKPDMSLANIEYLISRLDMLYNNVAQTVRDHYAMDMQKIRNVLVSLEAALKNPSDAGGGAKDREIADLKDLIRGLAKNALKAVGDK